MNRLPKPPDYLPFYSDEAERPPSNLHGMALITWLQNYPVDVRPKSIVEAERKKYWEEHAE